MSDQEIAAAKQAAGVTHKATTDGIAQGHAAINLFSTVASMLDNATAGRPKACRAGCSHCCHESIWGSAPEVFAIATAIRLEYAEKPAELASILNTLREHARATAMHTTATAYAAAHVPCPFLDESGECGIYEFRPLCCRINMSLDAESCRAFYDGRAPDVAVDLVWNAVGTGALAGMLSALFAAGRDANTYDFFPALISALERPSGERRWATGDAPFPKCPPARRLKR